MTVVLAIVACMVAADIGLHAAATGYLRLHNKQLTIFPSLWFYNVFWLAYWGTALALLLVALALEEAR